MSEYGFSPIPIFRDRIFDSVFIRENMVKIKPEFWYSLRSLFITLYNYVLVSSMKIAVLYYVDPL